MSVVVCDEYSVLCKGADMNQYKEMYSATMQRHANMVLNDWLMNPETPLEKIQEEEGQIKLAIARVERGEVTSEHKVEELKQRYTAVLGVNWS